MKALEALSGAISKPLGLIADISAAASGQTEALQARRFKKKQELDDMRKAALAEDMKTTRALLDQDPSAAAKYWAGRIPEINRLGGDPEESQALLDMFQSGDLQGVQKELDEGLMVAQAQGYLGEAPKPISSSQVVDGQVVMPDGQGGFKSVPIAGMKTDQKTGLASAVTKIYQDGTTIQALPSGAVQVTDPDGNQVTGEDRRNAIRTALENELQFAQTKSGAEAAGSGAIRMAEDAFNRLDKVSMAISNIDEGIRLIDQGAQTGTVISRLPSISSASKQLDNLQKRMGLDVIGNTTFGALSESELRFALDAALPKNLAPKDLRRWLLEKKTAQSKLASYLEDAAIYLGTPGNTASGWLKAQRELVSDDPEVSGSQFAPAGGYRFDPQSGGIVVK